MTNPEDDYARALEAQLSPTADRMIEAIIEAAQQRNGPRGTSVIRLCASSEALLVLVMTRLVTRLMAAEGEPAVADSQPAEFVTPTIRLRQVAYADQVAAAYENGDLGNFASEVAGAMMFSVGADFRDEKAATGHWPTLEQVHEVVRMMPQEAVTAMAAYLLRNTLVSTLEGGK